MIIFGPWALGTTQRWSIETVNVGGYVLGGLLAAKWLIRRFTGYQAGGSDPRGVTDEREQIGSRVVSPSAEREVADQRRSSQRGLMVTLGALTILILVYTAVSALNPRAVYKPWLQLFEYQQYNRWLPHSYDPASTWSVFRMYLGLACFFWAIWDWLSGGPRRDHHEPKLRRSEIEAGHRGGLAQSEIARLGVGPLGPGRRHVPLAEPLPRRLQLLLWVLCINGSLLALEAILQRLSGTNKLLWLAVPMFNTACESQFGPYAYRANAATYFNLIWPVCLGLWLVLRQSARPSLAPGHRVGSGHYLVLLPGAVLMAACPIISTSRGGALVAVAAIGVSMVLLLQISRHETRLFRYGTCALFIVILGFSAFLGLRQLVPRFQTIFTDQMSQRTEIYENALPLAREFPVFGIGPGTFGSVYQLYRRTLSQEWHAYLHDDWLETRITFGWVGFVIILLMLGMVVLRWFRGGGLPVSWELVSMIWIAMGGCLLHAKFDFPFQIYSITQLFLVLCAILASSGRVTTARA
ncbi:MAG: O-antigen ligase family protein [Verrucomicrobiota bacterium]